MPARCPRPVHLDLAVCAGQPPLWVHRRSSTPLRREEELPILPFWFDGTVAMTIWLALRWAASASNMSDRPAAPVSEDSSGRPDGYFDRPLRCSAAWAEITLASLVLRAISIPIHPFLLSQMRRSARRSIDPPTACQWRQPRRRRHVASSARLEAADYAGPHEVLHAPAWALDARLDIAGSNPRVRPATRTSATTASRAPARRYARLRWRR